MQLWQKLVRFPDHLLAQVDPVEINLACAEGLPGAENINRRDLCESFDGWAQRVRQETLRLRVCFERDPGKYENSAAYFRMLVLFTVLQRDLGVRYNPALIDRDDFFADAKNLFVHGVLHGDGGTCTSLPPVFAAVGRRLGYPLTLATTKYHVFMRWDDPKGERFNMECSCQGLKCSPDEHYLKWPVATNSEEVTKYCFLKSKSPREELALYLANRGHCFRDNGLMRPAIEAYAWAAELEHENRAYSSHLSRSLEKWHNSLAAICPQPFPSVTITFPPRQFREVPKNLEQGILHLNTMDDLLRNKELEARWWTPMRQGTRPRDLPEVIGVEYKPM